jgi:nitrogen fixation protein FixH
MDQKEESRNVGRKFWIGLLLFFLTFASVDAFFVYKALNTHTGVVDQIHGK